MSQIALGQRMNALFNDIKGSYCLGQSNLVFSFKMSTARFLLDLFNCHCHDYKFWKCLIWEAYFISTEFYAIHKLE